MTVKAYLYVLRKDLVGAFFSTVPSVDLTDRAPFGRTVLFASSVILLG